MSSPPQLTRNDMSAPSSSSSSLFNSRYDRSHAGRPAPANTYPSYTHAQHGASTHSLQPLRDTSPVPVNTDLRVRTHARNGSNGSIASSSSSSSQSYAATPIQRADSTSSRRGAAETGAGPGAGTPAGARDVRSWAEEKGVVDVVMDERNIAHLARDGYPEPGRPGHDAATEMEVPVARKHHGGEHGAAFDELFFDLLFVANLSVYSESVELHSLGEVAGFMGYFALLWWSWFSQALFDVRFRTPSSSNLSYLRGATRASQVGVWVGFTTTASEFGRGGFGNFAAVYALSRLTLACDFGIAMLQTAGETKRSGVRTRRVHLQAQWPLALSLVATLISGALWFASRAIPNPHSDSIPRGRLAMWLVGISVELVVQFGLELSSSMKLSLKGTHLPERMALLSLIVLGEGFVGIGTTLNELAPGGSEGGWDGTVLLQVASSSTIIFLLFVIYFQAAVKELHISSPMILAWAYGHVFSHLATVLVVTGVKHVITSENTIEAALKFLNSPLDYLPQTAEYAKFTSDYVDQLVNDGIPMAQWGQSELAVVEIFRAIISFKGASIMQPDQALALSASTTSIQGVELPTELKPQLEGYLKFSELAVGEDSSLEDFLAQGLFQYSYIYLACAGVLLAECLLKLLQERKRNHKQLWFQFGTRAIFAVVLVCVQIVFLKAGIGYNAAKAALPICAAILLLEIGVERMLNVVFRIRYGKHHGTAQSAAEDEVALHEIHH